MVPPGFHAYDVTRTSDFEGSYGIHTCLLTPFLRVRARTCLEMTSFHEHLRPARGTSLAQEPRSVVLAAGDCPRFARFVLAAVSMVVDPGRSDTARRCSAGRSTSTPSALRSRMRRSPGDRRRASRCASTAADCRSPDRRRSVSLRSVDTGSADWTRFSRGARAEHDLRPRDDRRHSAEDGAVLDGRSPAGQAHLALAPRLTGDHAKSSAPTAPSRSSGAMLSPRCTSSRSRSSTPRARSSHLQVFAGRFGAPGKPGRSSSASTIRAFRPPMSSTRR